MWGGRRIWRALLHASAGRNTQRATRNALCARTHKGRTPPSPSPSRGVQGGISKGLAQEVVKKWDDAGVGGDPRELRKLFLRQSATPILGTALQVGAAARGSPQCGRRPPPSRRAGPCASTLALPRAPSRPPPAPSDTDRRGGHLLNFPELALL